MVTGAEGPCIAVPYRLSVCVCGVLISCAAGGQCGIEMRSGMPESKREIPFPALQPNTSHRILLNPRIPSRGCVSLTYVRTYIILIPVKVPARAGAGGITRRGHRAVRSCAPSQSDARARNLSFPFFGRAARRSSYAAIGMSNKTRRAFLDIPLFSTCLIWVRLTGLL